MLDRRIAMLAGCLILSATAVAQQIESKPASIAQAWGDQGDGTFVNPVLPADFSDIDVIRVGDDYYAISSTLHLSPGMAVLHSKDLIHWEIIGHAVADVTQLGPEMNWDRMNRYGRGVWAGAIRYHDGKYWIYFGAPDEGLFMTTAANPAGPWAPLHKMADLTGFNDTCPFWDDDGQGYLVTTQFSRDARSGVAYNIHLFKLSADGKNLLMESDRIIHQSRGSEANKLYKINGFYYHCYSEVKSEGRVIMMNRAKSLDGPWETKQLNHVAKAIDKEPNQGGLMQLASGDWWFLTHQGTGDWEGRALCLLPVEWNDGWPVIGKPGADGIGTMVWSAKKPLPAAQAVAYATSDDFSSSTLAPQWEWNHQPRADKWSLTEHPGFLRLHAFKTLDGDNLKKAGNTISQRALRTTENSATIKLDLSGMADGQKAGMCRFARTYSMLGIEQTGGARTIYFNNNGTVAAGPAIAATAVWLRSSWGFDGVSRYSYSLDGKGFIAFGEPYQLTWGNYRGDRVGVFCYNNAADSGYLDVDAIEYAYAKSGAK